MSPLSRSSVFPSESSRLIPDESDLSGVKNNKTERRNTQPKTEEKEEEEEEDEEEATPIDLY
jgi:hypothetical protein